MQIQFNVYFQDNPTSLCFIAVKLLLMNDSQVMLQDICYNCSNGNTKNWRTQMQFNDKSKTTGLRIVKEGESQNQRADQLGQQIQMGKGKIQKKAQGENIKKRCNGRHKVRQRTRKQRPYFTCKC